MIARGLIRIAANYGKQAQKIRTQITPAFRFCSTPQNPAQVQSKLLKIVEKEADYETQNYQYDESAQDFLKKVGFELIESDGDHNIELRKKVGDTTIIVHFQSRSPQDQQEPEQQEDQQNQDKQQQENQEQDYQDYSDFTVYIQKKNGKALAYECSSVQTELQVNLVSVVDNLEEHKKTPRFERGVNAYAGPDFETLDDRLQSSLLQYLKSHGINEELAAFIEHYSLDKEQRLYMSWLNQLSTFLKN